MQAVGQAAGEDRVLAGLVDRADDGAEVAGVRDRVEAVAQEEDGVAEQLLLARGQRAQQLGLGVERGPDALEAGA
ncbi:MAG: hypothetical protein ACK559_06875, partial [bacterium]